MPKKQALTVERFERIPWGQLFIRSLIEVIPQCTLYPHGGLRTTIELYNAMVDTDHNESLLQVIYRSSQPSNDYERETGLEIALLGSSTGQRSIALREILSRWGESVPPWASTDVPVAAFQRSETGRYLARPPTGFRQMQHYARLYQRVANEIVQNRRYAYLLCSVFYRLDRFIEQQNKAWEAVVGH